LFSPHTHEWSNGMEFSTGDSGKWLQKQRETTENRGGVEER